MINKSVFQKLFAKRGLSFETAYKAFGSAHFAQVFLQGMCDDGYVVEKDGAFFADTSAPDADKQWAEYMKFLFPTMTDRKLDFVQYLLNTDDVTLMKRLVNVTYISPNDLSENGLFVNIVYTLQRLILCGIVGYFKGFLYPLITSKQMQTLIDQRPRLLRGLRLGFMREFSGKNSGHRITYNVFRNFYFYPNAFSFENYQKPFKDELFDVQKLDYSDDEYGALQLDYNDFSGLLLDLAQKVVPEIIEIEKRLVKPETKVNFCITGFNGQTKNITVTLGTTFSGVMKMLTDSGCSSEFICKNQKTKDKVVLQFNLFQMKHTLPPDKKLIEVMHAGHADFFNTDRVVNAKLTISSVFDF